MHKYSSIVNNTRTSTKADTWTLMKELQLSAQIAIVSKDFLTSHLIRMCR